MGLDKDEFGLDSIKDFGDEDSNEFESSPQEMDYNTFRLRTDPSFLLDEIRSEITRKVKKHHKGGKLTDENGKYDWSQIPDTEPMCNASGVEEIMMIMKKNINNHTVQGNTKEESHRQMMRRISDHLTTVFWKKRKMWSMELADVNTLIGSLLETTGLFLSRTINNRERELFGETFKENTTRQMGSEGGNKNPFDKLYNFLKR